MRQCGEWTAMTLKTFVRASNGGMNPGNGTAQDGNGEVGPLPARNNAVEQVFGNPVIWKIIGSYLNMGDLKACRLVNSQFHGMVMKEANFLQRSLVSLKPHQISRNHFGSSNEPWRNLLLKFGNPGGEGSSSDDPLDHDELEWLYPLMSNVESLSLRMEKGNKGDGFHPLLKRLLNAPKALRALALEPIFLTDDKTENFDACEDVLENLEEFHILQPQFGWQNGVKEWTPPLPWVKSIKLCGKMKKLRVLKSFYHPLPAPKFRRGNVGATPQEHFPVNIECMALSDTFERIALDCTNTLKEVTLGGKVYRHWYVSTAADMDALVQALSFPSLESAAFYAFQFRPHTVTKHLLILPMLKELEVSVEAALPIKLLNAIGQRSDCLRKLKIQSRGVKYLNWQFLQSTQIEEFRMELHYSDCPQGETLPDEVLNSLPLTIRRLFVRAPLESNPIPALARLNPSLVTQLTFIDSGDCFTDDTMRFIVENFRMLRKLNATNAKRLTDAGFVGSSSQSGSLSAIKGLRTLILRECGSITDATLREIRFLELHYLDLSYNKQLTKEGYEGLLTTNPSLETLLMSCKNIYRRKDQMYVSHPRLSAIVYRRLEL